MAKKNKTNRSLKKRFKITGTGKLKRNKSGKRHLNSHKTGKHIRRLGKAVFEVSKTADKIIEAMGGA